MAAARPASPPPDPAFHDYFLITSHPDRREITCYSIIYPLPRELNQFCANFLASLRTPRAAFCEETLIATLLSPEPWHPRITIATPPDHPIPEPIGCLSPPFPNTHFLTRPNHAPEFTDRLIMPREPERGVTHRLNQTPSPHAFDVDSFLDSCSTNEVFDLVLAMSPAASLSPSSASPMSTHTPSPASPTAIANLPSDSSFPYSQSE